MSARSSSEARASPGAESTSALPAGPPLQAADALGGVLGCRPDDRLQPVLHGLAKLVSGDLAAGEEAGEPVADGRQARLQLAHELARPDDLVPPSDHLAAQERAAAQRVLHLLSSGRVRQVCLGAEVRRRGQLLRRSALVRPRDRGGSKRTGQRPADSPGLRVGRQPVEPAPYGCEVGLREATVLECGLSNHEQDGVDPTLAHHLAQVSRHVPLGVVGYGSAPARRRPRSRAVPRNSHGTASA